MARRRRRRGIHARQNGTFSSAAAPFSHPLPLPLSRLEILTQGQVEEIHEASLTILSRTGLRFNSATALGFFKQAGARLEGDQVYLDQGLVEAALKSAPAQYTLHARNPANSVTLGDNHCLVMPSGGPPYVRDLDGIRRPGTLADVENFTRLSAMSPEVHVIARKVVEAQDVPVAVRHLSCWYTALTLADKPIQSGFVGGQAEAEDVLTMLAIIFGGEAALEGRPVAHCSVNANSPLLYDKPMLESLITFASFWPAGFD